MSAPPPGDAGAAQSNSSRRVRTVAPQASTARRPILARRREAGEGSTSRAVWLVVAMALAGCRSSSERTPVPVFAASSLTEAFTAMEAEYERAHPGDDVRLTFAGSQVLRLQIEQGAPAQVFASANPAHVAALASAGQLTGSDALAQNRLTVITPASNPLNLLTFNHLERAKRLVIGSPQSPIGQYTRAVLSAAAKRPEFAFAARPAVVSEESNVRLVRAKVELGEADAAIVYRSDARAPGVRAIAIPDDLNVAAEYRIGAVRGASPAALRFIAFALSPAGQGILTQHGFDRARP